MKTGDRVRVTGIRGLVIATVEQIHTPAELPNFPPPAPAATAAAEILEQWGIDKVATLSYNYTTRQVLVFVALHATRPEPGWRDLQGQVLEIEPATVN